MQKKKQSKNQKTNYREILEDTGNNTGEKHRVLTWEITDQDKRWLKDYYTSVFYDELTG